MGTRAWLWLLGGLAVAFVLCGGAAVGLVSYLVDRGEYLRAPRVLPNGYTTARYTHEGNRGGWGLTPPGYPFGKVQPVDADGNEVAEFWWVERMAIGGDTLVVVGKCEPSLRKFDVVVFELDTLSGKMKMLPSVAAAEQRVEELKFGPSGGGWVDLQGLPRAARKR